MSRVVTPEEIVARAVCDHVGIETQPANDAAVILAALRAAGYRIVQLPVGHHHVTVAEDGTHTAVPLRRLRVNNIGIGWVDDPVEDR